MKKKALISSILAIALCLSLIAGSTYALFTSETKVDVTVNAGKVGMTAGLTRPILYSVKADPNGAEFDEHGASYTYVRSERVDENGNSLFTNNGKADFNSMYITLEHITPGDKIEFQLTGANTSNVYIQYRYRFEVVEGYDLAKGFAVTINGTKYESLASYVSPWAYLGGEAAMKNVDMAIELPVSAGNEYQDLTAKMKVYVEAVQSNAVVEDNKTPVVTYINSASTAEQLTALLNSKEPLHIFLNNDIDEDENGNKIQINLSKSMSNKVIDANGHNAAFVVGGGAASTITFNNVTITNLIDKDDGVTAILFNSNATGNFTITNSKFVDAGSDGYFGGVSQFNTNLDLTIDNCDFTCNDNSDTYGAYGFAARHLTITNSTFTNLTNWAILVNGTISGDVVINGCTFKDCDDGVIKLGVLGSDSWQTGDAAKNFTFVNNKIINCAGHYDDDTKKYILADVDPVCGKITFMGNTIDGVPATIDDMGIIKAHPNAKP